MVNLTAAEDRNDVTHIGHQEKSRGYVFHCKHRVPPLSPSSGVNGTDVTASIQKGQVDQTSGTCDTRMTHAMYKGASVILLRLG